MTNSLNRISGQGGFKMIADTAENTGVIEAIVVNADAVFAALEMDGVSVLSAKGLSGVTVKQGMFLVPNPDTAITKVTLTSGSVIVYYQ